MKSKSIFKKISKTKYKLEQNWQHTNKTQCPNKMFNNHQSKFVSLLVNMHQHIYNIKEYFIKQINSNYLFLNLI